MAWHILHTHTNQELRLKHYLESKNIISFAPLTRRAKKKGGLSIVPFFPRYVLTCVDLGNGDNLHTIRHALGLRSIVEFLGRPAVVPIEEILLIQSRTDKDGYVMLDDAPAIDTCGYRHGDLVRIRDGAHTGLTALFDKRLRGEDVAQMLLQSAGFLTNAKVHLPLNSIERVLPEEFK